MSSRVTKPVQVGGFTITVREMTMGEILAWMKTPHEQQDGVMTVLDQNLFDGFAVSDLFRLSDLTEETAIKLAPSELDAVYAAAKELNNHFFAFRQRLLALGRSAAESQTQT